MAESEHGETGPPAAGARGIPAAEEVGEAEADELVDTAEEAELSPLGGTPRGSDLAGTIEGDSEEQPTDFMTARSEIDNLVLGLDATGRDAAGTIVASIGEQTRRVEEQAADTRSAVRRDIGRSQHVVAQVFSEERNTVSRALNEAEGGVSTGVLVRQVLTVLRGVTAALSYAGIFVTGKENLETTIVNNIGDVEKLKKKHQDAIHDKTVSIAGRARSMGQAKANSYNDSDTEKRDKKRAGVIKIGNKYAEALETKEPEGKQAVADGLKDLPGDFRKEGDKAKEGLDNPLPQLFEGVQDGVAAARETLADQGKEARRELTLFRSVVLGKLREGEADARRGLKSIQAGAEQQIRKSLGRGRGLLRRMAQSATEDMLGSIEATKQTLREPAHPQVGRSRRLARAVTERVRNGAATFMAAAQEAGGFLTGTISAIRLATGAQAKRAERQVKTGIDTMHVAFTNQLDGAMKQINESLDTVLSTLAEAFDEVGKKLTAELKKMSDGLDAKYKEALRKADTELTKEIDKAYAKPEAQLPELDPKMDEAADKIGWDHDHPVLSFLRDLAGAILGFLWGLLKLLVNLVRGIILAIIAIIVLVILGVELAVAMLIVAIVFVVVLAVQTFFAYRKRAAEGKHGFWGNLGLAVADVAGLTKMYLSFKADDLTPFERGEMLAEGIGDLAGVVLTFVGLKASIRGIRMKTGLEVLPKLDEAKGWAKIDVASRLKTELGPTWRARTVARARIAGEAGLESAKSGRDALSRLFRRGRQEEEPKRAEPAWGDEFWPENMESLPPAARVVKVNAGNIRNTPPEFVHTAEYPDGAWKWSLYDEASGAKFCEVYVKTSGSPTNPRGGPELWLHSKQALLPGGERVQLKADGFRWTPEATSRAIRVFRESFGRAPENMSGDLAADNLAIYQKNFAEIRAAQPGWSPEAISNEAIRTTPFGKTRIEAGYGDFRVQASDYGPTISRDGTELRGVPRAVHVEALPTPNPPPSARAPTPKGDE